MTKRTVFDVAVWSGGAWNTDTFGMTKAEAEAEMEFMKSRGFVVKMTERPAIEELTEET